MATECAPTQLEFHALGRRDVVGCFDGGRITSDGGGLLLREVDPRIGLLDLTGSVRERERDRGYPLAGSSTLNRLEPATRESAAADRYKRIAADPHATDDPLHGQQEGRFFHGYYGCYCYLPLFLICVCLDARAAPFGTGR